MPAWLPVLDSVGDALVLPLWMAGALAALFVVICIVALNRDGPNAAIRVVVRSAVVLVAALMILALVQRPSGPDNSAIEARVLALNARVLAPASPLACLTTTTGEVLEASCEKVLFASPETTAAALSFVEAQLALLADAALAKASIPEGATLTGLRRAVENDRYGLVAQVFAARHGCVDERCPAFALLHDPARVGANLKAQRFDTTVRRYAAVWLAGQGQADLAAAPAVPPSAAPVDFPSAASIPPVSIMNNEPPTAAAPSPPPVPPAAARRQAATGGPSQNTAAGVGSSQNAASAVQHLPMPLPIVPNVQ